MLKILCLIMIVFGIIAVGYSIYFSSTAGIVTNSMAVCIWAYGFRENLWPEPVDIFLERFRK